MRLVVGLGNPGAGYARNRHNIGFMAADEIVRRHAFSAWRNKFQAELADGTLSGEKVIVLKPLTYMNLSGQAVGEALRFYKILPKDVIVIYDEIELPPGKIRVKQGGGHAGHNGLRSLDQHIGKDYWRVRLGVGRPPQKEQVANYVLHDFAKADEAWLTPLLDSVATHLPVLVKGNEGGFMNKVTLDIAPPKPAKPPKADPAGAASPASAAADVAADKPDAGKNALQIALEKAKAKVSGSNGTESS